MKSNPRRRFLRQSAQLAPGLLLVPSLLSACTSNPADKETQIENEVEALISGGELFFSLSLAQWSLHKHFFDGSLNALDFPKVARQEFEIGGVEYVNQFFKDKAEDQMWLSDLKQRAEDHGVTSLLIMCDGEGNLGDSDEAARQQAVENHHKWVEAAAFLGCHSIRVNAAGQGTAEEVQQAAIDGLGRLSEFANKANINVLVENHGGYSSDGKWLSEVMRQVGQDNCGTLPDFGNFCIERKDGECVKAYDRYQGLSELMPFAKGVSAKSYDFDAQGRETLIDFGKMLKLVKDAKYTGYIGVEYEGSRLDEYAGIRATKALLMRIGKEMS
jgi:sugar phosphate isomerase/epimerase